MGWNVMTVIPSSRAQNFKGSIGIMIMVKLHMVIFLLHSSLLGQNKEKKTDCSRWVMAVAAYTSNGLYNGWMYVLLGCTKKNTKEKKLWVIY